MALSSCGQGVHVDPAGKDDVWEATTARGLAAAVLQHLDGEDPHVGVTDTDYPAAHIDVGDDDLDAIFVSLAPDGPGTCDGVPGYRVIECAENPYTELSVNPRPNAPEAPVLEGRYADARRGSVLVQVWGEDTEENRDLVRGLVRDHLIGLSTTHGANEAGAELRDVVTLRHELSGSVE